MDDTTVLPQLGELKNAKFSEPQNTFIPLHKTWPFDAFPAVDPLIAYLKVRRGVNSFLWECSLENDPLTLAYSVLSTEPWKVINNGTQPDQIKGNPLEAIEAEISQIIIPKDYKLEPSILNGGAFGYIGYDCVKYFEPKVAPTLSQQQDKLQIPEAVTLFTNSFVFFDHLKKQVKIVALCRLDELEVSYQLAVNRIAELEDRLRNSPSHVFQNGENIKGEAITNAPNNGYHAYVRSLRESIIGGDIIQAVPSQRISKKTGIHPWNIYKRLRVINPSRYGFFLELDGFTTLGLSPELLVKVMDGQVTTHPIAGTRKRGQTKEEDEALANELLSDEKERAEHIMLVDLGRNDINRACIPESTTVTSLMHIEKFSHVMHIVSWVTGKLRPECKPADAFRSIFPAGTVSGAPKIRAIELVGKLEKEKRGVYAGTVGYFSFSGDIDTCIAIRTLVHKDGTVYFQAGGGIVFDSTEEFENEETLSKMRALTKCVQDLEDEYTPEKSSDSLKLVSQGQADLTKYHERFSSLGFCQPRVQTPIPQKKNKNGSITLMIDNYDSFTWNLYQYLNQLGEDVVVFRNDAVSVEQCLAINPKRLVISPGPGDPTESGLSGDIMKAFMGKIPILGVCLGHEVLVHILGGEIISAGEMKHGKTSVIQHDGKGLYEGITDPFSVIRYHSLTANPTNLPDDLVVVSRTANDLIMGVRHKTFVVEGVQYHPESIKTDHGMAMLKNFVNWKGGKW